MELEMQAGRLMTEMAARDESYEQELKLNALKFNELADKYQATVTEKDQVIRNLQEKVAILDSDLNKKDSLLRNLRDELLEAERKKTSHIHNSHIHSGSPKHSTTSASAINLPH
jgi:DNA repair exonuclease SbcCD ATPase subunit